MKNFHGRKRNICVDFSSSRNIPNNIYDWILYFDNWRESRCRFHCFGVPKIEECYVGLLAEPNLMRFLCRRHNDADGNRRCSERTLDRIKGKMEMIAMIIFISCAIGNGYCWCFVTSVIWSHCRFGVGYTLLILEFQLSWLSYHRHWSYYSDTQSSRVDMWWCNIC